MPVGELTNSFWDRRRFEKPTTGDRVQDENCLNEANADTL
jgi:hypothetical protein